MSTQSFRHQPYQLPALPIAAEHHRYPVRQIYCTGLSYAAHALELGRDPVRDPPVFFMKSVDAVVPAQGEVDYPPMSDDVQLEVELVAAIGRQAHDVPVEEALDYVFGYAIGLDLTRRDLELAARRAGRPWEFGKSFRASAAIGPIHAAARVGHPMHGAIWMARNEEATHRGDLAQMAWSVAEQIAFLSSYYTLHEGDLLMTGAPAGLCTVRPGDRITAGIDRLGSVSMRIRERQLSFKPIEKESSHG
jgi:fumarylpyruvate hydrolase